MRRPFSLTSRLFFMLVLAASLIGATGLKTYEYFSYKIERDKLSVRVATASVRISKALIKPAESADIEGVRHILSAFAASPEITCVKLELKTFDVAEYWPFDGCEADQAEASLHRQPIRQAMRRFGHADIYFTDHGIAEEIRAVFMTVALGIAGLMASQLIVIFFLNKHLIASPIAKITTILARLARGDKDARIGKINSSAEFSALAQSYDAMAEELAEQEKLQRQYTEKIDQQNKEITQSLTYAAVIQNGLTGLDAGYSDSVFDLAMQQRQLSKIGGDYCVGLDLGTHYLVFFADATGHGVPGALATMLLASSVRIVAGNANPPKTASGWLAAIHDNFQDSLASQTPHKGENTNSAGLGADACLILFHKDEKSLSVASAKTPIFVRHNDEVSLINGDRISIGYDVHKVAFHEHNIPLSNVGDMAVFCTDGIFDQPDASRNFGYGKRRLSRFIASMEGDGVAARDLADMIFAEVEAYACGAEPVDDRTVLVIKHKA